LGTLIDITGSVLSFPQPLTKHLLKSDKSDNLAHHVLGKKSWRVLCN
jgi:hypothetical protein